MDIAIIGTGRLGQAFAKKWCAKGHKIIFGSRTPNEAHNPLPEQITITTITDAVEQAEVVLFAFPWHALTDVEREVGKLANKIIIDAINPLMSSGSLAVGHKSSAAEQIAFMFSRAHVVKAFNHLYYQHIENNPFADGAADAFICGDSDKAKGVVGQLAQGLGYRPVDCGPLKMARHLEPMAALWIQMAFHFGHGPDFSFKLIRP